MLSLNLQSLSDKKKESLFTAVYIGSLFIILALVYYIHLSDNLWDSLVNFFTSLTLAPVPNHWNLFACACKPGEFRKSLFCSFSVQFSPRHLRNHYLGVKSSFALVCYTNS